MKIGTLTLQIYAELKTKQSIEILQAAMYQPLLSISDKFDFDYRRFGYFAAKLIWVIPLKIFWKNDHIYNILKETLNTHFINWNIDISLLIHEEGV